MLEMYPVHGHKRLDDDAFLASLSLQESDSVVFSMRSGAVLLKHNQELSYRKQIARQLHIQYVEDTHRPKYRYINTISTH